jgi:hypothetical protein
VLDEELRGFGFVGRLADQETLGGIASSFEQDRLGGSILKTLGDDAQTEVVAETDGGSDYGS